MIGYEMSSSLVGVCTSVKTSPMKNFKHVWKIDMGANMATLSYREFFEGQVSWTTSIPRDKNLATGELQLEAFSFFPLLFLFHLVWHTNRLAHNLFILVFLTLECLARNFFPQWICGRSRWHLLNNTHGYAYNYEKLDLIINLWSRGVHCTKHVWVYVSAQKGY